MGDTQKRERFGRYLILDHLVDGGMAKICRARFLGEQADKVVAIKMVQPQFSKDPAFKTMFMDEIKVTFGLLHPNVIQTYDYGIHRGQLFVAMEYCDGRNLKEYLDKLKERKFVFPVEISTYIISQACQGLYYAHTFRDKLSGVQTNIIHRDISPHNIMLTYDGAVKIIDFGIAKSQTNSEMTQAGTIKGKLSYLAPEYLEGLELDPRYDQFALGITLWEMLCSRKLFKENNDLAILKKIQECKIPPPSSINPNVPKELDEIVLKALSKDRNKRFENLDQMNRALMKFLYAKYPDFNGTDLSYFSQELFREEIKKDREKMFEFGKIDIKAYLEELKKEAESGVAKEKDITQSHQLSDVSKSKENVIDFGFEERKSKGWVTQTSKKIGNLSAKEDSTSSEIISKPQKNPSMELERSAKSANQKSMLHKRAELTRTSINTKEEKNDYAKKKNAGLMIATVFLGVVAIGAYLYFSRLNHRPVALIDKNLPVSKNRHPAQMANGSDHVSDEEGKDKGNIVLSHFDKQKMQVFVDGQRREVDLLSSIKIPLGKELTLRVQIEGKRHFVKEIRADNSSAIEIEIPDMPAIAYGYINTSSRCAEGEIRFELYGEKRVSVIPMSESFGIPLPLGLDDKGQITPQSYQLFFKKKDEDIEHKIEVTLNHEDQTVDLCDQF